MVAAEVPAVVRWHDGEAPRGSVPLARACPYGRRTRPLPIHMSGKGLGKAHGEEDTANSARRSVFLNAKAMGRKTHAPSCCLDQRAETTAMIMMEGERGAGLIGRRPTTRSVAFFFDGLSRPMHDRHRSLRDTNADAGADSCGENRCGDARECARTTVARSSAGRNAKITASSALRDI